MFCPKCGVKLNEDTKFCSNCGAKIEDKPQSTQADLPASDASVKATPPKKKGGAAKVVIPVIIGLGGLFVGGVIAIIAIVAVVLGTGDKNNNDVELDTEYYSEEVTAAPVTEEETEPVSKYSTADAEKFYLDLVEENNGLELYYIASTNESNVGDVRIELVGIECLHTYVADGYDYSNVVIDGVRVFDTLTEEEYRTLLFNGANSNYTYFVFDIDDINAYFDSIWEPGRFTAEDFAASCKYDVYISESGYLFYGMGAQGFADDCYKTKIISSEAVDGGFKLKVKLIDAFVDMGETDAYIYDCFATDYTGIYSAGDVDISTFSYDEVVSGANLTDDDFSTLTVNIVETDDGLRLRSITY